MESLTFLGENYQPDVWLSALLYHITVFILVPVCQKISPSLPFALWYPTENHYQTELLSSSMRKPLWRGSWRNSFCLLWKDHWECELKRREAFVPAPLLLSDLSARGDRQTAQQSSIANSQELLDRRGGNPKLTPSERATSRRKQNRVGNSGRQSRVLQAVWHQLVPPRCDFYHILAIAGEMAASSSPRRCEHRFIVGRSPCLWPGGRNWVTSKVPSSSNHSVIPHAEISSCCQTKEDPAQSHKKVWAQSLWAAFVCDGNWWVISLPLVQPMRFLILFSPPVLLRQSQPVSGSLASHQG